eukprot:333683_1
MVSITNIFVAIAVVSSISFCIVLLVGIICTKQLLLSDKIQPVFKNLFYISWSFASIGLLFIFSHSMCHLTINENCDPLDTFGIIFIYSFAFNLLLILIYRLYFSFKDSSFAISKTTKWILITLYCLILLFLAMFVISFIYLQSKVGWDSVRCIDCSKREVTTGWYIMSLNIVTIPLYIVTTIITIIIFAKKLLKFTNLLPKNESDMNSINLTQIKLIDNATRYVALLSMGIISSFCLMVIVVIWWHGLGWQKEAFNIIDVFLSIDCVINIIGLYLQFSFGRNYYDKYCKGLHLCWKHLLTKNGIRKTVDDGKERKNRVVTDTNSQLEPVNITYDQVSDQFSEDDEKEEVNNEENDVI